MLLKPLPPLPLQKELADVYMNNLAWMKALRKDPIHKKIMATRDDYVNNDMFDQDEAVETAIRRSRTFSRRVNRKMAITMKN